MSQQPDNNQRIELDRQADAIERTLQNNHAPARVTGGNVTPRWIQFQLQPAPGIKSDRIEGLSHTIARALGQPAAIVKAQGGAIRIDIPRSNPQAISLSNMLKRLPAGQVPAYTAVLGLADDGAPLLARLPSPDVKHIVISGPAGAGKTALTITIALSLAAQSTRRALQLVTIGAGLSPLAGLPHLNRDLISAGLPGLVNLIERRAGNPDPHIAVIIDDLAALSDPDRAALNAIFEHGRESGVHAIGATRQTVPSGNDRALLIAAQSEPIAAGEFVAYTHGPAIKFAAAYATPGEIGDLIATIGGGR